MCQALYILSWILIITPTQKSRGSFLQHGQGMDGIFVSVLFLSLHEQAGTEAGYLSNPKKAGLEARTFIFFPAQIHWPYGPSDALIINPEPI